MGKGGRLWRLNRCVMVAIFEELQSDHFFSRQLNVCRPSNHNHNRLFCKQMLYRLYSASTKAVENRHAHLQAIVNQGNPILGVHFYLYSDDVLEVNCPHESGNTPGLGKALCHAVSDSDGMFTFTSIPCGTYKLIPFYKGENTVFDVSRLSTLVSFQHDHAIVRQMFQVRRFASSSIVGNAIIQLRSSKASRPCSFKLALQWPKSFSNASTLDRFTIHGLWPQDQNDQPYSQSPSHQYPQKLPLRNIQHLIPRLKIQWPNLKNSSKNNYFWEHEWEKHGFYTGFSPSHYFLVALRLRSLLPRELGIDVNVRQQVQAAAARVGSELQKMKISNVLTGAVASPEINCNKDQNGTRQIKEVMICFDKDFMGPINCNSNFSGYCKSVNDIVVLPS